MAGIFLSHSTHDKPIVTRLAADLIYSGFPVWLDSWKIEAGDSLPGRIFEGIDECEYVLVALTPTSVQSDWVRKEFTAALTREEKLKRKVVIPLRLEPCDVPTALADRLYADFSEGYTTALERLRKQLHREGASNIQVPLVQELLPLKFTKCLYLQKPELQARMSHLAPRISQEGPIHANQVVVVPDEPYTTLRTQLATLVDKIADHPLYSPKLEEHVQATFKYINAGEAALTSGVAALANGLTATNHSDFFADAAYWFARLVRNAVLVRLMRIGSFLDKPDIALPVAPITEVLSNDVTTAQFYEVAKLFICDVFRRSGKEYFKVMINEAESAGRWLRENPRFPCLVGDHWTPTLMYNYIIPQMLVRHFWLEKTTPLVWDYSNWLIGAA